MYGPLISDECEIVKHTGTDCTGTVIFLHDAGDSGKALLNRIKQLVGDFSYPHIEFYFPTAESIPYIPLDGKCSRVWFDQWSATPDAPEIEEHMEQITMELESFTDNVRESLPRVPSPWFKTIIGGFGMGGTLALNTAYRCLPYELSGVFALSSYLNYDSKVYEIEDGFGLKGLHYICVMEIRTK